MKKKKLKVDGQPKHQNYQSIGDFLRDTRVYLKANLDNKFTQFYIAQLCGYDSAQHISNIERGLALPSLDLAVKLIKIYKIERIAMYELFLKYRESQYQKVFLAKKIK